MQKYSGGSTRRVDGIKHDGAVHDVVGCSVGDGVRSAGAGGGGDGDGGGGGAVLMPDVQSGSLRRVGAAEAGFKWHPGFRLVLSGFRKTQRPQCGAVCAAHAAQQSDAVATLYITLNEPGVCQQTPTVLLEAPHVRAAREDQAETNSSMTAG